MSTTVAVADGVFNIVDAQPVLLGSRCTNPQVADTHACGAAGINGVTVRSR